MNLTISQLDILINLLEAYFVSHDGAPLIYHRLHNQLFQERKEREDLIK